MCPIIFRDLPSSDQSLLPVVYGIFSAESPFQDLQKVSETTIKILNSSVLFLIIMIDCYML